MCGIPCVKKKRHCQALLGKRDYGNTNKHNHKEGYKEYDPFKSKSREMRNRNYRLKRTFGHSEVKG